jgi:hypothetical protein
VRDGLEQRAHLEPGVVAGEAGVAAERHAPAQHRGGTVDRLGVEPRAGAAVVGVGGHDGLPSGMTGW